MKKVLLLTLLFALLTTLGFSQSDKFWSENHESTVNIIKDKAVGRLSFPKEFKLFTLNLGAIKQELFTVVSNTLRHTTVISLPNVDGKLEQFEIVEASNFEPDLQAQFPEIRAFSGKGITDRYATLKLSISPQGIQTMIFRTDKENEFIEPYSQDHTVYAVFRSHRTPGLLPWSCTTEDRRLAADVNRQVANTHRPESSAGQLKTMRLAQSVTAEYSNYFGATSASQVSLVLAGINATLTRCNGCYEKDLGVHLNLVAASTNVIYYNAATDPYDDASTGAGGTWNLQLQQTLTNVIGSANYDIGHLFGASGGGGNAGCIGCVCVNPTSSSDNAAKGSGFTSPADGIPQGDNFDIDYVVHEVGHQLGANHTFTFQSEGGSVANSAQKEIGSGITIMGYAGITPQDVAPHSIDIYHEESIAQIQANLATKTCPVTTSVSANNATPVVGALTNYTIPISTPFALTGSATDANAGDALTYCWEENDATTTSTGANSKASATKTSGPNWLSFSPTSSPTRICPELSTILSGLLITPVLPGGDAGINIEALSSVARTLNFRLTVRDNAVYSSTAPVSVGQTNFQDMVVTVSAASGPFAVTSPNTAVSWAGGSTQTITWAVASTTASPVSCANVKISLSTDGGQTFPTVLAASTPNDGTEALVIPNTPTTTARIKVEAVGNIFFDISNTNFTITAGSTFTTITGSAISPLSYCAGAAVSVPFTTNGAANAGNVFTAQLSNASGSFASPVAIGTLTSTAAGTIAATIPAATAAGTGYRIRVVSSAPVVTGSDNGSNITVNVGPTASSISAGGATTFCAGGSVLLSGNSTAGTWSVGGGTTATLSATTSGDYYTTTTNGCGSVQSNHITVTVNPQPVASTISAGGNTTFCAGGAVLLSGNSTGGTWSVVGGTTATLSATTSGDYYTTTTNGCGSVQSNHITVTVNPQPVASVISAGGNTTFCAGGAVLLSGNSTGGTWSVGGGTTATLSATTSGDYYTTTTNGCGSVQSNHITVTVNAQPVASTITAGGAITFCAGGSVVLSGNTTGVWNVGTNNTSGSITVTTSGDYFVTTTNSCGTVTSNHITVTVNPQPVASTITAGGNTTFCTGGSVLLSGNSTAGTWSIGGGTTATLTATTGGDYYTTTTNGCGSVQSNHIIVTVNSQPVASVISAGGNPTFCAGGAVLLSGNSTGGTWSVGGGTTATLSATTSGDYYTTTTNGCGSIQSNHITVTVNPLPTVSFSGLASSYSVTAAAATLTGSPAGGTFSGPGISGNTFTPSAAGSGGPYTITYTYTNGNGCTNSSSQQTTVTGTCTLPGQPGTITTVGGTAKVCPGDVKTYTIAAVSGAAFYTWTAPAGGVVTSGQGTTSATVTYNSGFTVGDSLRVTANNTCGSGKARALKINRNSPASTPGAITGLAYGVCNSSAVPYSVTAVTGDTYTWSWSVTDATVAGGQGTNAITANFAGTFLTGKLSVTAANACGASSARSLTVYARPAVPGAITGSITVCPAQQGVPYSIAPVSNASSYIWYGPSGSHISDGTTTSASTSLATTATSVTVNFGSTAGQVRVKAVNSCAAGGVAATTVAFGTCKEGSAIAANSTMINNSGDVLVYPNPSNGNFRIILGNVQQTSTVKIDIINEFGQLLYQSNEKSNNGIIDMNLSDRLTNGIYLVSCTVNGVKTVKKLMISK